MLIFNNNEDLTQRILDFNEQFRKGNINSVNLIKRIKKTVPDGSVDYIIESIIQNMRDEELSSDLSIKYCEYKDNGENGFTSPEVDNVSPSIILLYN